MRALLHFATALLALSLAGSAAAQPDSSGRPPGAVSLSAGEARQAQRLFRQGVESAQAERWQEALEHFEQSRRLVERPSTLFNIALCLQHLGRLREALSTVDLYLAVSGPVTDAGDRTAAIRVRTEVLSQLGSLQLRVTPAEAEVELDGVPQEQAALSAPLPLEPGRYRVVVRAPGYESTELSLELQPGQALHQSIVLVSSVAPGAVTAPDEGPSQAPHLVDSSVRPQVGGQPFYASWWFWTTVGVVVAGAVTGAVLLSSSSDRAPPVAGDDGILVYTLTHP